MSDPSRAWISIERSGVRRWRGSVEVRGERDPVIIDASQVGQAEDLEPAGVGQDRPIPGHEPMEAAQSSDALRGRAQVEVIRVSEDHLRTGGVQVAGRQGLHSRLGADGHEVGRQDRAVRRVDATQPGMPDAGGCKGMSEGSRR